MVKAIGWEMFGASSATCPLFAGHPGLAQGCWGLRASSPDLLRHSSCNIPPALRWLSTGSIWLSPAMPTYLKPAVHDGTCMSAAFPGLAEFPPRAPSAKTHVTVCPTWVQFWGGSKTRSQVSLAKGTTMCNNTSFLQHPGETQAAPDPHCSGRQAQGT